MVPAVLPRPPQTDHQGPAVTRGNLSTRAHQGHVLHAAEPFSPGLGPAKRFLGRGSPPGKIGHDHQSAVSGGSTRRGAPALGDRNRPFHRPAQLFGSLALQRLQHGRSGTAVRRAAQWQLKTAAVAHHQQPIGRPETGSQVGQFLAQGEEAIAVAQPPRGSNDHDQVLGAIVPGGRSRGLHHHQQPPGVGNQRVAAHFVPHPRLVVPCGGAPRQPRSGRCGFAPGHYRGEEVPGRSRAARAGLPPHRLPPCAGGTPRPNSYYDSPAGGEQPSRVCFFRVFFCV